MGFTPTAIGAYPAGRHRITAILSMYNAILTVRVRAVAEVHSRNSKYLQTQEE